MGDIYDQVLEIVAENPEITSEELEGIAADNEIGSSRVDELLEEAVSSGDALELAGRRWVKRIGRYSFQRYDHPET